MKQELEEDYDITCDNLVDMDTWIDGFEHGESEFYSPSGGAEIIQLLINIDGDKQIFKTKDGRYVLEVLSEDATEVSYFWSNDINDLA